MPYGAITEVSFSLVDRFRGRKASNGKSSAGSTYHSSNKVTVKAYESRTSGYIILSVVESLFSGSKRERPSMLVTLESAIYSWPCVKTGIRRSTPTELKDWPCDLFTVIAKHKRTGNCLRATINGSSPSEEVSFIRGISRN